MDNIEEPQRRRCLSFGFDVFFCCIRANDSGRYDCFAIHWRKMIDQGNSQFEYGERPAKCSECGIVRTQPSKELKEGKCIDEGQCRRFAKELGVAKAPDANNAG